MLESPIIRNFFLTQRLQSLSLFEVFTCLVGLRVGVCDVDCGVSDCCRSSGGSAVDWVVTLRGAIVPWSLRPGG